MSGNMGSKAKGRCSTFGPTALKTVALAIDLAGWSAANSHGIVEKALENKKLQEKLAKEFKKAGEELMKEQAGGMPLSLETSLGRIGSVAAKTLQKPATSQAKKSSQYKKLDFSLTQLQCAFDNTQVGVFVNENKTMLIVVGVVAGIGGGIAMYHTKSGDVPAKAIGLLPELSVLKIGAVDLSVKNLKFTPSERRVGADVKAVGKWTSVKANLEMSATFANDSLQRIAGNGSLVLTLDPRWQGTASGSYSWSREDAGIETKSSGAVGIRRKLSKNANLNLQLYGKIADNDKGTSRQVGAKSSLAVKNAVGKNSRLIISPDYHAKRKSRSSATEHRFFINLRLEF